jgi:hypothetical protein
LKPESDARRSAAVNKRAGLAMTEQDLRLESERIIDEALREIEAIKVALEASREKPTLADTTVSSADRKDARTN